MVQIDNNISDKRIRLTIRIGEGSMMFAVGDPQADDNIVFEPYELNNSISIAANLRDEYREQDVETLYKHTFKWQRSEDIVTSILPELNALAVFAVNKDLKMVVDDHFADIRVQPLMQAVWTHLYRRAFTGTRQKLFAYFHDKRMEVMRFQRNRFEFSN